MPTWVVVLLTITVYSFIILLGFKYLQKGTNHMLMFLFPVVFMDSEQKREFAAKQLGIEVDDIFEVTKGRFASKSEDKFIVLKPFFGIECTDENGVSYVKQENKYDALTLLAKKQLELESDSASKELVMDQEGEADENK